MCVNTHTIFSFESNLCRRQKKIPQLGKIIDIYPPLFHVLCVEDDSDACAMLSELLKLSGIKCQCAESAAEAWNIIRAQRFDLYLLDAWLPDLDGPEQRRPGSPPPHSGTL